MSVRHALTGLLLVLATPAAFAQANCITFEGRHGGVSGEIVLDLDESQVRIGTGWWTSITRRGEFGEGAQERRVTLQPGDRFTEPFDPRQGCDARRAGPPAEARERNRQVTLALGRSVLERLAAAGGAR